MKRKAPPAQPGLDLDATDVAPKPAAPPPWPPCGPMPRKPGDLFLCSGCQKMIAAPTKGGKVTFIQLGRHESSIRVVTITCSTRCANKIRWCGSCEVFGHTREDGPDVCPRWYKGRRMRDLKLYRCEAHRLVDDYRRAAEGKTSFYAGTPSESVGRLLAEHEGDFAKVRKVVEDIGSDRMLLVLERAERDDPWWGAEPVVETPADLARQAKQSIDQHRKDVERWARGENHSWTLERATPVLLDVNEKMNRRTHAALAYGSRATTEDAVRVLVPLLQHEDSSMRSCAAMALFTHRTPEVRVALLARAEVENVPRLKAYMEELGRSE